MTEDWQAAYQYGLLVIFPPQPIRDEINTQRRRYDPVSQSAVDAHITITQPFLNKPRRPEWEQIEQILENFHPFQIQFGPLKSFLPYPCIWYDIQPAEEVLALRNSLHTSGLFDLTSGYIQDFVPHMTITEGLSGPEVNHELLGSLQIESRQGEFSCQELTYIVPDSKFKFHEHKKLPLSGE